MNIAISVLRHRQKILHHNHGSVQAMKSDTILEGFKEAEHKHGKIAPLPQKC